MNVFDTLATCPGVKIKKLGKRVIIFQEPAQGGVGLDYQTASFNLEI